MSSLIVTNQIKDINMNISQDVVTVATEKQCFEYINNLEFTFNDAIVMNHCALKAGLSLLNFQEIYGNPPHHRYDLLDLEGLQMDGDMPRVHTDETLNSEQHRLEVDVSKGRLAEAARMGLDRLARSEPIVPPRSYESARSATMSDTMTMPYSDSELKEYNERLNEVCNDDISQAVSGSHYNDVVPGYQYMEMMQHMLDGKEGVEAHLLGQTYKYLMRSGKKDDVEQEYRKARWYLNCLVKYKQTGEIDPNNND
jgi:hypothetical protein